MDATTFRRFALPVLLMAFAVPAALDAAFPCCDLPASAPGRAGVRTTYARAPAHRVIAMPAGAPYPFPPDAAGAAR